MNYFFFHLLGDKEMNYVIHCHSVVTVVVPGGDHKYSSQTFLGVM